MQFINIFIPDTMTCKYANCCMKIGNSPNMQAFNLNLSRNYYIWCLNFIPMKRKLIYTAGLVFIAFSFTTCDAIKNCKICSQNTYNGSTLITAGSESEYCNADLIKIQATPDVTVLGVTTKWVCR